MEPQEKKIKGDESPKTLEDVLDHLRRYHPKCTYRIEKGKVQQLCSNTSTRQSWQTVCLHNNFYYKCKICNNVKIKPYPPGLEVMPIDDILAYLRERYPFNHFRQKNDFIQRQTSSRLNRWERICYHNKFFFKCDICENVSPLKQLEKKSPDELAEIYKKLCAEHPESVYRIFDERIWRQEGTKKKWRHICEHNIRTDTCFECDGRLRCEHRRIRSGCVDCKGARVCFHEKLRYACKKCKGGAICEHSKVRYYCKKCPGRGICLHGKVRSRCVDCGGKGLCIHLKPKPQCRDCGGSMYCLHQKERANCKICVGSRVCGCGVRLKTKDGYCTKCHPDYIETGSGCSKEACRFIDRLQIELGVRIQHKHANPETKVFEGVEHRPAEWPQKGVDGFYVDSDGTYTAIEYLGNIYHGHPDLWEKTKWTRNKKTCQENFEDTEKKLRKLKSLGYRVIYIWSSEYKNIKGLQSTMSICREFQDKLEY
jgi:hypothetical protein